MDDMVTKVIETVLTHAGIVESVQMKWESDDLCKIQAAWRPWSQVTMEDITTDLLEAGTIVNETCAYKRIRKDGVVTRTTVTVDLADMEWRRNLAKQLSFIIGQEIRAAVLNDE